MESKDKDIVCVYHAGCRDGFGAAYAVWLKHHDATFIPGYYGSIPDYNVFVGKIVYFVDFSYKLESMNMISSLAKQLVVIDHHKSNEDTFKELYKQSNTHIIFDNTRSGAILSWTYFHPNIEPPIFLRYIQDRDLWENKLPSTKTVNAYISTWPFDFRVWNICAVESTMKMETKGIIVLDKIKQYITEVKKNMFTGHLYHPEFLYNPDGADSAYSLEYIPIVNAPQCDISELLDDILSYGEPDGKGNVIYHKVALGFWQRHDKKWVYSLRSRGDFDVSEIAKLYGGGGHKNAAGFESDVLVHV